MSFPKARNPSLLLSSSNSTTKPSWTPKARNPSSVLPATQSLGQTKRKTNTFTSSRMAQSPTKSSTGYVRDWMGLNATPLEGECVARGILSEGIRPLPAKARMAAMLTCWEFNGYNKKLQVDQAILKMIEKLWNSKSWNLFERQGVGQVLK